MKLAYFGVFSGGNISAGVGNGLLVPLANFQGKLRCTRMQSPGGGGGVSPITHADTVAYGFRNARGTST